MTDKPDNEINLKEIVKRVAQEFPHLYQDTIYEAAKTIFSTIDKETRKGNKVSLTYFGRFMRVAKRKNLSVLKSIKNGKTFSKDENYFYSTLSFRSSNYMKKRLNPGDYLNYSTPPRKQKK